MADPIPGADSRSRLAVEAALRAAVRAPSPHNTQPWRFVVEEGDVDVLLDRARVLRVADPEGREALLACGAAVLNLRLAFAAETLASTVELLPDKAVPDLLARVRQAGQRTPTTEELRLARMIGRRHTNRRPFEERTVPAHVRHTLTVAAAEEGARLILLEQPRLDRLAVLLRRADHEQSGDPAFRAELRAWTHEGDGRRDGVPYSAGGPRALREGLLALRDYAADSTERHEREFERAPLVGVLTTTGDTRRHTLRAGQAMERVLLTATAAGLNASFLAQPIEIGSVREELRSMLGEHEFPQTVLRFGFGYPGGLTPRRTVDEVTRWGGWRDG
ncbi:nitroreductase [Prauserella marina]|uniref:Nitroreductase family protein n=1 Tax=Prauserella marina TaxID=530584 RepID=A0A222VS04_9PSEU|nr:nitroreductase family protein [Prauserella marina]ASR36501.1 nitroreductase [Prauserella marina]PWV73882.1 nitroreductase family protein [Prauserella marina]SDD58126.1 Nitroreductase family protein [Prauserella marina]